ncbi:MAG: LuxR family transcriptional regulator [Candidatus Thiodiazotropha sp.]
MKIEDAIDDMQNAAGVERLFDVYSRAAESYGYDRVLMALLSDHPRLQQSAQHGVLSSYPEEWVEYYLSQGYDEDDPVKIEIQRGVSPFSWNQLLQQKGLSKRQRVLFDEAAAAHLHDGLGIPLHGPGGASAGIGLASSCKGVSFDPRALWAIHNLSVQFYACYWHLNEKPSSRSSRVTLTPRESEVLKWLASGLTKSEVADRLIISYHTVDFHTRSILRKFKTGSITAAVHFATAQGYIKLD